jgi:hypothetical protein
LRGVGVSEELTAQRLRELFSYDPNTGVFHRRVTVAANARAGDVAGARHNRGYLTIRINQRPYLAHRLAWLYVHGELPVGDIDHANCDKTDNRISNLRISTRSQNVANTARRRSNKSGYKGVFWDKASQKWRGQVRVSGRNVYLGSFDDKESAHAAYVIAAERQFGEFARVW